MLSKIIAYWRKGKQYKMYCYYITDNHNFKLWVLTSAIALLTFCKRFLYCKFVSYFLYLTFAINILPITDKKVLLQNKSKTLLEIQISRYISLICVTFSHFLCLHHKISDKKWRQYNEVPTSSTCILI